MKKRTVRFLLGVVLGLSTLVVAQVAYAYLPANIENVIKSWFNSAGQLVRMTFSPSAARVAKNNKCDVYMNQTTGDLEATCDEQSATVLASASSLGCHVEAGGHMVCNTFTSLDQNSLTPAAANRFRIYDNDVDLNPNPACAQYGLAGVVTLFDSNENATDNWIICNGTETADYLNPTATRSSPYGVSTGGSAMTEPADDDDCRCWQMTNEIALAALEKATVRVAGADADDTLEFAVYDTTGATELFEATATITGIAVITMTNGITAPAFPRGDYWLCVGFNQANTNDWSIDGAGAGALQRVKTFAIDEGCPAGEMPATVDPSSAAWASAATIVPSITFTDE